MRRFLLVLCATLLMFLTSSVAVAAEPNYPPPSSAPFGSVDRNRVNAGECVIFSGQGFAPATPITVRDNGKFVGTTTTDQQGKFAYQVCFRSDTRTGRHILTGTGLAPVAASRTLRLTPAFAARTGSHVLTGTSVAPAAASETLRLTTVSATVFVTGVSQSITDSNTGGVVGGGGSNGGLAFTGLPAVALSLLGIALVGAGSGLLLVAERRHRRRRRRVLT